MQASGHCQHVFCPMQVRLFRLLTPPVCSNLRVSPCRRQGACRRRWRACWQHCLRLVNDGAGRGMSGPVLS